MSLAAATQSLGVTAVVFVVAYLLRLIRQRISGRSQVLARALAVATALLLSQLVAWYVPMLATPSFPLAMLAGFLGMLSVQPEPWSVASLCRAFAVVSALVTVRTITTPQFLYVSVSLLTTVLLLYVSLLASQAEKSPDQRV